MPAPLVSSGTLDLSGSTQSVTLQTAPSYRPSATSNVILSGTNSDPVEVQITSESLDALIFDPEV